MDSRFGGGVYVLGLEGGNFYVGHTSNIDKRIAEHFGGLGSEWTKLHHPISIIETRQGGDLTLEENMTIDLMCKYGWEKVRGGPWVEVGVFFLTIEFDLCVF